MERHSQQQPLLESRSVRRRVKGRWSGPEAKYQFLLSCLCDSGLTLRLEELKGASHWWPWLSCNQDEHGDEITYLCPTYVLYDALSPDGRGDLEKLYQRPTALKVFSEMLRSHLDAPWLSKYMTLPGGGRESRKVMLLKIDVHRSSVSDGIRSLADGIRSRLRPHTIRHACVPVLLTKGPGRASENGEHGRGARPARTSAKRRRSRPTNSTTSEEDANDYQLDRDGVHGALSFDDTMVMAEAASSDELADPAEGHAEGKEEDAAVALLGLCVDKSMGMACTTSGHPEHDDEPALHMHEGHDHDGQVLGSPASPPPSWPVKRSRHPFDTFRFSRRARHHAAEPSPQQLLAQQYAALPGLPVMQLAMPDPVSFYPGLAPTALPCALPAPGQQHAAAPIAAAAACDAMLQLMQWQQQQLALSHVHARLARAAGLLSAQLAASRAARTALASLELQQELAAALEASCLPAQPQPAGADQATDVGCDGSAESSLLRVLTAVRSWELPSCTSCCQVYVPSGTQSVDVPHVSVRHARMASMAAQGFGPWSPDHASEHAAGQAGATQQRPAGLQWQPCAALGCRYLLSVGPYCVEHLQQICQLAARPAQPDVAAGSQCRPQHAASVLHPHGLAAASAAAADDDGQGQPCAGPDLPACPLPASAPMLVACSSGPHAWGGRSLVFPAATPIMRWPADHQLGCSSAQGCAAAGPTSGRGSAEQSAAQRVHIAAVADISTAAGVLQLSNVEIKDGMLWSTADIYCGDRIVGPSTAPQADETAVMVEVTLMAASPAAKGPPTAGAVQKQYSAPPCTLAGEAGSTAAAPAGLEGLQALPAQCSPGGLPEPGSSAVARPAVSLCVDLTLPVAVNVAELGML